MNKLKAFKFTIALGVLMAIVSSCSTARKVIKEPLKEQGTEFLFNSLKANELNFTFFSAHFNTTFMQDKSQTSLSGQIRIYRDSLIWISVSPMVGIEMVRILVTNDSIKYINRLEKTYFTGSYSYINHLINSTLDFDMLQSFLTGNDFSRYENTSFKGGIDNMEYKLVTDNRRKLKKYVKDNQDASIPLQQIWLNPETFKITRILVQEANISGRKAEAEYDHELVGTQLVPSVILLNIETDKKKTSLNIQYSKLLIPDELQFPFKVPEKYNRIEKL